LATDFELKIKEDCKIGTVMGGTCGRGKGDKGDAGEGM
jgi:hypothetical protein